MSQQPQYFVMAGRAPLNSHDGPQWQVVTVMGTPVAHAYTEEAARVIAEAFDAHERGEEQS